MTDPAPSDAPGPPLIEQLGALYSLLVHDLANQLCIITGSASFAQLVLNDPERLGTSLNAILQAGDSAGFALERFGELRRALPATFTARDVGPILERLRAWAAGGTAWTLEVVEPVAGGVRMPPRWVVFAMEAIITETRATTGHVTVRQRDPVGEVSVEELMQGGAPTATGPSLSLSFTYASDTPFSIKEARTRYENMALLAVYELNRGLGGRLDARTIDSGQQEVLLELPLEAPADP